MNVAEALPTFIAESADLLREMEAGLLECAGGAATPESVNLVFRSAHTIKGSAGLFGLQPVVRFVHVVETALDFVRLGHIGMSEDLVGLLLRCRDHIEQLIAHCAITEGGPDPALERRGAQLLEAMTALTGATTTDGAAAGAPASGASVSSERLWQVSVRFGTEVLRAGIDPLGFIRYLQTFGEILESTVEDSALPVLAEIDPESCYLGFELTLRTAADPARIEAAFEFVREDCTLTVKPKSSTGAPTASESAAVALQPAGPSPRVKPTVGAGNAARSLRVDADKLDYLITRVGELIIAAAGATLVARQSGQDELSERMSTLTALVEQVREGALQLRMVKIGETFSRFQRVVHDVARELGKEIRLLIRGAATELDKTVVERIADPLTHLVRNAIDHGIEAAEVRAARGKPAHGTVTLNAYHDSGSIVIEVSDDGGGLNRERILAKAIERGLAAQGQTLTDDEVFACIFEPGFSTAQTVTDLSGRGVGMDVVKRNITAVRGSVTVRSHECQGTTVTIRLPLTLAIIKGFQVAVGGSSFILPLECIEECIEFSCEPGHDFTNLRGEVLPFIRLRELLGTAGPVVRRQSIVVVRHAGARAGLVVDMLLGELQTVIKPLGRMFHRADYAAGSSILGNGEVALILDVPALIRRAVAVPP